MKKETLRKLPKEVRKIVKTIEDHGFNVMEYEENGDFCGAEIEGWTDGGVDMIHFIDLRKKDQDDPECWKEEIEAIAAYFDIDEEIDLHREDVRYRSAFSIRQSVHDFEKWEENLRELAQAVMYPEIKEE